MLHAPIELRHRLVCHRDGSKLRQGADAQTLNESTGGSLAFGKPSTLYMLLWTA